MFSVLAAFFLLSVLNNAFVVVFALFAYTPVKTGGLGLSVRNARSSALIFR